MKIIQASEIGTYRFCQRAWWYYLQGYQPVNKVEFTLGRELHEKHNRVVMLSNCLQYLAYGSILLAIIFITAWIIQSII